MAPLLSLVTAPSGPGVADRLLTEHLRLEGLDADATYVRALELAAVDYIQGLTGRQLLTATYTLTLDAFPEWATCIVVPRPPLQAVTSITYLDAAGVSQPWSASGYRVLAPAGPHAAHGAIHLAAGQTWPSTQDVAGAVTVTFTAGYGEADAVPAAITQALLILVAHWFEHREPIVADRVVITELPLSVRALLRAFRVPGGKAAA